MSTENLSTYTEIDPNGVITVTSNRATATSMGRNGGDYVYTDKGVDYFDALNIDFVVQLSSAEVNGLMGVLCLTNTVGAMQSFASTDLSVYLARDGSGRYMIHLAKGTTSPMFCVVSVGTTYYCSLHRPAGGDVVLLRVYTDAARTTLYANLTITGLSAVKWRYIYAIASNSTTQFDRHISGYCESVEIGSYESIVTGTLTYFTEVHNTPCIRYTDERVTLTNIPRNTDEYLYIDKGSGFFNDLQIDFAVYIDTTSANYGRICTVCITNTVNDMGSVASTDLVTYIYKDGSGVYQIHLNRGAGVADTYYNISGNTVYYCRLVRSPSADTVYLDIYSDPGRSTLLNRLSLTGFGTTLWRYLFATSSWNSAQSYTASGYCEAIKYIPDQCGAPIMW